MDTTPREASVSPALPNSRQILVTGPVAYDHIMDFPGLFKDHILPDKLHVINISFLVEKVKKQRGGCAANIAYTLALLGLRPKILAMAGSDFAEYRDWLVEQGIDVQGIGMVDDEITATCFITTDRGNSQITGFYPGAMSRSRELSVREHANGSDVGLVVVAPDDPAAISRHCREAREAGVPLLFDPSFQVTAMDGESLAEAARGARFMILNDYEMAVFEEKTGLDRHAVHDLVEIVVVTLGEEGSKIFRRGEEPVHVPSAPTTGVVDPTGAGDAYRGGFVAALSRGHDLVTAARFGGVAAAYAIECYGTSNHRYTQQEFAARYEASFGPFPG
jgi:adenosine kinase